MILADASTRTGNRPASFRWKAFAIHLALSLVVLGALLYVLFIHWFPGYLFDTDGGWQALRVIAGVDIILGPLLTLIAANPRKSGRELRNDFTAIGLVQVCALCAGTWLAWDNRPYAMLWYDGVVYSMPWSALKTEASAVDALNRLDAARTPHRAVVNLPRDPFERAEVFAAYKSAHAMILADGGRYTAWPPDAALAQAFSRLSLELAGDQAELLGKQLANARNGNARLVLTPTRSRYETYFLLLDPATGEVAGSVRIPPAEKVMVGVYSPIRLQALLDEITGKPAATGQ